MKKNVPVGLEVLGDKCLRVTAWMLVSFTTEKELSVCASATSS